MSDNDITRVVRAEAVPVIRERVEALAKRAKRLGLPEPRITSETPNAYWVELESGGRALVTEITIENGVLQLPGYALVAALDHTLGDEPILLGPVPAEYRDAAPTCEHCGLERLRSRTYIVRSEAGELMQVGSSCLRDFTGRTVSGIALDSLFDDMKSLFDEPTTRREHHPLPDVLAFAMACIREHGWLALSNPLVESGEAWATATLVQELLDGNARMRVDDRDREAAEDAIAWAQALTPRSDYELNIHRIAKAGCVSSRFMGFGASLAQAYLRQAATRTTTSEHVGEPGDRMRGKRLTLAHQQPIGATRWGERWMVKLHDADGRLFVWWTGQPVRDADDAVASAGTAFDVDCTLKAHSEYRGEKQNVVTRCRLTPA